MHTGPGGPPGAAKLPGRLRRWDVTPPRQIAFQTRLEVHRGGYASDLLYAATHGMDSRDAGLAEEIVFGALRFQAQSKAQSAFDPRLMQPVLKLRF